MFKFVAWLCWDLCRILINSSSILLLTACMYYDLRLMAFGCRPLLILTIPRCSFDISGMFFEDLLKIKCCVFVSVGEVGRAPGRASWGPLLLLSL